MITNIEPETWKDLEAKVAEILSECGFTVDVEKIVPTARGHVELDVYAEEVVKGRKYTIVCECKYWKASIPQTVIHGFRTVVNDLGCNLGYVITTSDFQKGAFSSSEFTNVELMSWYEFQNKFLESWFEGFFVKQITGELDPLMSYTEPILPKWFDDMSLEDQEKYYSLKEIYDPIGFIVMGLFSTYSRGIVQRGVPKLPLLDLIKKDGEFVNKIPWKILTETGYKELLDKVIDFGKVGISEFRRLRDKYYKIESKSPNE